MKTILTNYRNYKSFVILSIHSLILFPLIVKGGDLSKAYKALNSGNYPEAKKHLTELIVENSLDVAGNYGLAKYFVSRDNKEFNLDSASYYINKAVLKTPLNPEDKETKKIAGFEIRDYTIQTLSDNINQLGLAKAKETNTVEAYENFIRNFKKAALIEEAKDLRNGLLFEQAKWQNNAEMLKKFAEDYPEAKQAGEALKLYDKAIYEESIPNKRIEEYKNFIVKHPNNPYKSDATKELEKLEFEMACKIGTVQSYKNFASLYPSAGQYNQVMDSIYQVSIRPETKETYLQFIKENKNHPSIQEAWRNYYYLKCPTQSLAEINIFEIENPDNPIKSFLNSEKLNSGLELKAFKSGNLWGYVIQPRPDSISTVLGFEYTQAYDFSEGLAVVSTSACTDKCDYYYIDKSGKIPFTKKFNFADDFYKGYAIVGTGACEKDDCKFGILKKNGTLLTPMIYSEIDNISNGFFLVMLNDKYGFLDENGKTVIETKYDDALPYKEGKAAVEIQGKWMIIDYTGSQKFPRFLKSCSSYNEGLLAATEDGISWGYLDSNGEWIIQPKYEYAEDFNGGFAIVSIQETDKKKVGITYSQRYKIDTTGKVIEKLTAPVESIPKKNSNRKRK